MMPAYAAFRALLHGTVWPLIAVVVLSCAGEGPTNTPPVVTQAGLTVSPAIVELTSGSSHTLQAVVRDDAGTVDPSAAVQWRSTNASIASVTATGVVTGVAVGNAEIIATSNALSDTAEVRVIPEPSGAFIEVHPQVTYQTMLGWEGQAQIGEVECNPTSFPLYKQEVVERLVNELGVNRVRIEIRPGHENPVDFYEAFKVHRLESIYYRAVNESVNDNNDPRVVNPAGFHFTELDHKEETILKPMRTLLAARGERLYINLTYVDFGAAAWEQASDMEEYAELIHTAFIHLRDRYGWVPDAVEISLEPDNSRIWNNGQVIGRAMVAAGDRLKASGFRPAFIAPSTTNMTTAIQYFDQMITVPRVREYLTDIAYHRYSGVLLESLGNIVNRASQYGLRTAMLEHGGSGHEDLHEDLKIGMNSAWQQFALAFCGTTDNGGVYYRIEVTTPTSPKVITNSRTRYLRQYFSFVRLNAVRVGATSGNTVLDPLAFRNTNNKLVVVIKASAGAPVQLRRLPAGTYGVTFTTATQTFASLPDVAVSTAGLLQVTMPAAGVMTIHQR
jgi:hypothetical protein